MNESACVIIGFFQPCISLELLLKLAMWTIVLLFTREREILFSITSFKF